MYSPTEIALDTAINLVEDRLDLIQQREPKERDRVEESKLKVCLKVLNNKMKAHKEDLVRRVLNDWISDMRAYLEDDTTPIEHWPHDLVTKLNEMRKDVSELLK